MKNLKLINETPTTMPIDEARAIAFQNQCEDDDAWQYVINTKGKSATIEVYDEENIFIGTL